MGLLARLVKNTGYLTLGNQIGNLLQFLFFLYFARQFGESVVGLYSFAFSFTFVFSVLADLGLSSFLIREVARDRSGERLVFSKCLTIRLFSLAVFLILAVLVVVLFFKDFSSETIKVIVLLGLFQIFFSIADIFLAEFKGHDRMGLVALLSIFVRFVISGAGILMIRLGLDFTTVLTCFPVGSFLYLIVCIYLSIYYYKSFTLKFRDFGSKNLLVTIIPFAFTFIFVEILYHLDVLLLRFFQNDQAVGIFSAANRVVLAIIGINLFVHTALLPTFSRLYVESRSELVKISKQSLRLIVLISLPLTMGIFALADRFIIFFFSETFVSSGGVLRLLSWTIAFNFIAAPFSVLLTAINRQTAKVIGIGVCLAFNFILNVVLIPSMSFNGAATAKLLAEALHLVLMAYLVSRYLTLLPVHRIFLKPALSCILMYIFIRLFSGWHLLYIVLASIVVYSLSLVILRGYSKEEIAFVKNMYQRIVLKGESTKDYDSSR